MYFQLDLRAVSLSSLVIIAATRAADCPTAMYRIQMNYTFMRVDLQRLIASRGLRLRKRERGRGRERGNEREKAFTATHSTLSGDISETTAFRLVR